MKIGLEIHQRLATHKLFCNCSSEIDENAKPTFSVERKLHPVLSELGEVDEASKAEFSRDRSFIYQVFDKTTCLVELDEEPPHPMNKDALLAVLMIAKQLHSTPLDQIHVMRKMVIDGSNTGGFQRTAIVSIGGYVETSKGKVRISQIAIEEDSAGIVEKNDGSAVYRLDRLGIPLVEITTEPDIADGEHLRETAEKIGMILRATGKVARGLGTIRQDVNISVEGGNRVEIKGAQDLKMLPVLVEIEANRQRKLIELSKEMASLFKGAIHVERTYIDVSKLLSQSSSKMIQAGLGAGQAVLALKLPSAQGLLGRELQPNKRFGTELSDYAKKAGVKGIIHSDEDLKKYPITQEEQTAIRNALHCTAHDAFALVIASKNMAEQALGFVAMRFETTGVIGETRKANADSTTNFMRPIPGKSRMYPETDVLPISLDSSLLAQAQQGESLEQKEAKLAKILNPELAKKMIKSVHLSLFEELVMQGHDAMLVATTLENTLVTLRRDFRVEFTDLRVALISAFSCYKEGLLTKSAIPEFLKHYSSGKSRDVIIQENNLGRIQGKDLERIVKECNYDLKNIMAKYRLNVDAQDVQALLKSSK